MTQLAEESAMTPPRAEAEHALDVEEAPTSGLSPGELEALVLEPGQIVPVPTGRGYMPEAKRDDQCSPPEIVDPVRLIFGGTIDLDPCSNPFSIVGAEREVMLPEWEAAAGELMLPSRLARVTFGDGLVARPWKGNVYFNPVYAHEVLVPFMATAAAAAATGEAHCIMLSIVKTSLMGWQEHAPKAAAACFLKGRVSYLVPGEDKRVNAPFHSCLMLWTQSRELVHRFNFTLDGKLGYCTRPA